MPTRCVAEFRAVAYGSEPTMKGRHSQGDRCGGLPRHRCEPLEGYDRAYVYDSFGNRLELMRPLA